MIQLAAALPRPTAHLMGIASHDLPDLLTAQFAADGAALAIQTEDDRRPRFLKGAGWLDTPAAFAECMADGPAVAQLASAAAGGWRCIATTAGRRSTLSVPFGRGSIKAVLLHGHDNHSDPNRMDWAKAQTPLLTETIRYWASAFLSENEVSCLTSTLNEFDVGIFLFDSFANLSFANSTGTDLLTRGTILRRSGTTLVAATLADTVKLQSGLHLNLATAERDDAASAVFRLGSDGGQQLVAYITRLNPRDGRARGHSTAMLLCLQPGAEVAESLEQVCHLYGLSPTETRLAIRLVNGNSVAEASDGLHIKPDTARAYLKHIFVKTGARRQPDLVRILLRSLVGLRRGSRATSI